MNVLQAAQINKRRRAMTQNSDNASAASIFAGMMAALSDPAKATQQLAELQIKLDELEQCKADITSANKALDVRYGELRVKEEAISKIQVELASANADLAKRTADIEEAEAKLDGRSKKLARDIAALRDEAKQVDERAKAVETHLKYRTDDFDVLTEKLRIKAEELDQFEQMLQKREQAVAEAEVKYDQKVAALKSAMGV